jgi:hypothetical protein
MCCRQGAIQQIFTQGNQHSCIACLSISEHPINHHGTFAEFQLDIEARWHLDVYPMQPGGHRVTPRLNGEEPQTGAGKLKNSLVSVGTLADQSHAVSTDWHTRRVSENHICRDRIMAFPKNGGSDRDGFAHNGFGRAQPAAYHRPDVEDRNSADS